MRLTCFWFAEPSNNRWPVVTNITKAPLATSRLSLAWKASMVTTSPAFSDVRVQPMRCCQQALRGATIVAANGNRNAATDTATGVELLLAGLRSAGLNVDVNVGSMSDVAFASRVAEERRQLASDGEADALSARERLGFRERYS